MIQVREKPLKGGFGVLFWKVSNHSREEWMKLLERQGRHVNN